MNDSHAPAEGYGIEAILVLLVGLPWYFFSNDFTISATVHIGLGVLFLILELLILGRGSVIAAFLVVFVLSILIGILLVGAYGHRLGGRTQKVQAFLIDSQAKCDEIEWIPMTA